jgi:putative ABC transport system ATP-binding protein
MVEPEAMQIKAKSASPEPPAVVTRGLSYAFDIETAPKDVLHDIDFTLARGEFVILTGPSGAGKTTLMTLVGALRALQSGSCNVFGTELAGLSSAGQQGIRRQIGFIFQDHNLFDALTTLQTLALTMELAGPRPDAATARARASALLAQMGMAAHLDALPRQLSVGQKQRIAIARALINDPKLILADEPTAALDHDNAERVIAMLKERATRDGAAILMVTHDNRVFSAADRIVNMLDGRIDTDSQFSDQGGRALHQLV